MDQNSNFKTETTPEHKRNKKRGGKSIMKKFSKMLNFHNFNISDMVLYTVLCKEQIWDYSVFCSWSTNTPPPLFLIFFLILTPVGGPN